MRMRFVFIMVMVWSEVIGVCADKAPAEPAYNYLQYIETPLEQKRIYKIDVPPEVFDGCEAFPHDLQVRSANGIAWPFVFKAPVPERNMAVLPARKLRSGALTNAVRGAFVELQVFQSQLIRGGLEHNQLTIRSEGSSFRRPVKVLQRSQEDQPWRPLAEGWLMSFGAASGAAIQHVFYPAARAPFLRIEVLPDPNAEQDQVTLGAVQAGLVDRDDAGADWQAVSLIAEGANAAGDGWAAVELDVGARHLPVERMEVIGPEGDFVWPLKISGRNRGSNDWVKVSESVVYRQGNQSKIELGLADCTYRWIRMEFFVGPTAETFSLPEIRAYTILRSIYFEPFGPGKGVLRYGSKTERHASPGVTKRLVRVDPATVASVELGKRISLSSFADRKKLVRPWAYALAFMAVGTVGFLIMIRRMLL